MKKEITFLLPTVGFHGPPERTNENIFYDTSVRYGLASPVASHTCTEE